MGGNTDKYPINIMYIEYDAFNTSVSGCGRGKGSYKFSLRVLGTFPKK